MPRTWPSMRRRRERQDVCVFGFMTLTLYPPRVYMTTTFLVLPPPRPGSAGVNELVESAEKTLPVRPEIDPVCGMTVDPTRTPHRAEHGGRSWYFCCAGCRSKFLAAPVRFADAAKQPCCGHDHRAQPSREAAAEPATAAG